MENGSQIPENGFVSLGLAFKKSCCVFVEFVEIWFNFTVLSVRNSNQNMRSSNQALIERKETRKTLKIVETENTLSRW